jgi:hypothetical protein
VHDGHLGAAIEEDWDMTQSTESRFALREMIYGVVTSQMVSVVARLAVADLLEDGPKSVDELAVTTGTDAVPLFQVLRALAGEGVFELLEGKRFGLTPMAEALRSDAPNSLRSMAIYYGSPYIWQSYGALIEAVRTGETALDLALGESLFEYLAKHPDDNAVFNRYMVERQALQHPAIVEACDFEGAGLVVDVGGGSGALLAAMLSANPHLRGVLFDRPQVVAGAADVLNEAGVADRCAVEGGSFFDAVPPNGDVYLLSQVLHDWNDEQAVEILRNCRKVMSTGSRVLVAETILPPGNEPSIAKRVDVVMLVVAGGHERTEDEFATLFHAADLELTEVISTTSGDSLVEGVPV